MDRDQEELARKRLERQVSRYKKKHNSSRVADVLAAKRAMMVRRYGEYAEVAAQVSRAVCGVTDNAGVPCMLRFTGT